MRDAGKITVQRAIVHLIDLQKTDITHSDFELDLAKNEGVRGYFGRQVTKALGDSSTASALFAKDTPHAAADACDRLLQKDPPFVERSKELARLLMAAMRTHSFIAPGDLAVCLYTAENYPSTPFLALFKLDPGRALLQKVDPRGGGKQAVTLDAVNNVLPTEEEQLQKAALVPPAGAYDEFDLLLLDRQAPGVAAFFAKTFLNTMPARDAPTQTETFHKVVGDAVKQLRKKPPKGVAPINIKEATAALDQRDREMGRKKVSISGFEARLREKVNDDAAMFVGQQLKKAFTDPTVEMDKEAAEKLLYKKRFKGEYGVRFEVDSKYKDEVVVKPPEPIVTVDGKKVTRVILHVTDFEWLN